MQSQGNKTHLNGLMNFYDVKYLWQLTSLVIWMKIYGNTFI